MLIKLVDVTVEATLLKFPVFFSTLGYFSSKITKIENGNAFSGNFTSNVKLY